MFMPSVFRDNLLDDFMDDFSFPWMTTPSYGRGTQNVMKTDIRETDQGYELDIDLPGYKKEEVKAQLKEGYLTITASHNAEKDQKDENGKYIRRERYSGSTSRSFFVGTGITEEDIHAKFADGILKLTVPKDAPKKVEESKCIAIEG